tara:strand:+ start:12 stop:293 length:282 start_codon:yes stop_codon:yes gene_type:complete
VGHAKRGDSLMEKEIKIINSLAKQLVYFTAGLKIGDLVAHKTDLDIKTPYVITDIVYDIDKDEAYCQCSNNTIQDAAFKVIELSKLEADEGAQ